MARSDRLFQLLNVMRRLRPPMTAERLAEETGVSIRSIYRDIETLRASGARIEGAAGYGYTLAEDPALPPQNFDRLEIEALAMGLREVMQSGDSELAHAAVSAQTKIIARMPERQQREAMHLAQHIWRRERRDVPAEETSLLRRACWDERAVDMTYQDADGQTTMRRVYPLLVEFQDTVVLLHAWCVLRQDYRQFRMERIVSVTLSDESFRPRRVPLLRVYIRDKLGGDLD